MSGDAQPIFDPDTFMAARQPQAAPVPAQGAPPAFDPDTFMASRSVAAQPTAKPIDPLTDEFAKAWGFSSGNIGFSDILSQTWDNLVKGTQRTFREAQDVSGESGKPVVGSPFALGLTAPSLITHGIENMATTAQDGVAMLGKGVLSKDADMVQRGAGRTLAALTQIVMGMQSPDASLAEKATEYSPRTVQEAATGTGASRPFNLAQGAINRSMGAAVRDVRYGDPSQALIDNNISSATTAGRLQAVTSKLAELKPQIDQALTASPATVDIVTTLDPIIRKATKAINDSFETDEAKLAAHRDLNALWMNALRKAPGGTASVAVANQIKQGIGDAVNWEKRPTPMMPQAESAYREAYGAFKKSVNAQVPEIADLNENVSNLLSARNALTEAFHAEAAGTGPMAGMGFTRRLEAAVGHVLPAGINAAQTVARNVPLGAAILPAVFPPSVTNPQGNPTPFGPAPDVSISSAMGR